MAARTDQDCGAAVHATSLRRQMSYTSSRERADQPMHDHKLSYAFSFSTPASALSSSPSPPMSGVSSFESIAAEELDDDRQSSASSSTSSCESFHRFEVAAAAAAAAESTSTATTQAPAIQTMMTTQWSTASNESLFTIQASQPGDVGDLYYDYDGNFHRMNSGAEQDDAMMMPAAGSKVPPSPECLSGGMKSNSVKLAATMSISSDERKLIPSVVPTLPSGQDEAPATETKEMGEAVDAKETGEAVVAKETGEAAEAWYMFRCCWPSAAPSS